MEKSVDQLLQEQLEKLCEGNSIMLENAKHKHFDKEEVRMFEIVNNSIYNLGTLLNRGW